METSRAMGRGTRAPPMVSTYVRIVFRSLVRPVVSVAAGNYTSAPSPRTLFRCHGHLLNTNCARHIR